MAEEDCWFGEEARTRAWARASLPLRESVGVSNSNWFAAGSWAKPRGCSRHGQSKQVHRRSASEVTDWNFMAGNCRSVRVGKRLDQFADRFVIDEELWSTCGVYDGGGRDVDTEVMVKGRDDFLHVNGSFFCVFSEAVGCPDGLSGSHGASGEPCAADLGPVVTSRSVIDFWSSSEFAPDDDGNIIEHIALFEVIEQSAEALIEF